MRLAVVASHPIQYHAPLFRTLAQQVDLTVFYAHQATPSDQAEAGFGVKFDWDIDLLSGHHHEFLKNVARQPGVGHFFGCDTPEIGKRLAQGEFKGILLMGWNLKSFMQAIVAAKINRIPVFVRGDSQLNTPRSFLKRSIKSVLYPPFLRLFDAALYVGERSRAYWTHHGYPEGRLFFSPHSVDNAWFATRATHAARRALRAELGIASDERVILFAGKLVPFKRPLDVIVAAAQLKQLNTKVLVMVAGSGPLERELAESAKRLNVTIHMLGFRNQSQMPAAYAAADVLVLPSDGRETWGLVANEALSCGKPIIVSDAVGCAPDLAKDASVGRIFRLGDPSDLARALTEVFARPPGEDALEEKCAKYSIGRAVDGIMTALDASITLRNPQGL